MKFFWYSSPQTFYPLAGHIARACWVIAALLTLAGLYIGLLVAPTDAQQGEAYRIIFIHVAAAWMSMFLYVVMAFWAAIGLAFNTRLSSMMATAIAPTGALFTFIALWTGSLWGKPTWGTWWEWDARLTTTAILFFLYLGYLALRRTGSTADERGKRCAIAALIAFADVPISYLSVTWWQTLHQQGTVFNEQNKVLIDGSMAFTLVLAVVAFTMLYAYLVLERFELARLEEGREERELAQAIADRVAADQVEVAPA